MRKFILATALLVGGLSVQAQEKKVKEVKEVTFNCEIDCHSCEEKIMNNIPYEKGVKNVSVDVPNKQVTVKYRTDKNNETGLQDALNKLGYKTVVTEQKEQK